MKFTGAKIISFWVLAICVAGVVGGVVITVRSSSLNAQLRIHFGNESLAEYVPRDRLLLYVDGLGELGEKKISSYSGEYSFRLTWTVAGGRMGLFRLDLSDPEHPVLIVKDRLPRGGPRMTGTIPLSRSIPEEFRRRLVEEVFWQWPPPLEFRGALGAPVFLLEVWDGDSWHWVERFPGNPGDNDGFTRLYYEYFEAWADEIWQGGVQHWRRF